MVVLPVRECWGRASQGCAPVRGRGARGRPRLPHGRSPVRKVVSALFLAGAVRFVVGPPHLDLRCSRPSVGACCPWKWALSRRVLGPGPSPVGVVWVFVLCTGVGPPGTKLRTVLPALFGLAGRPVFVGRPVGPYVQKTQGSRGQGAVSPAEGTWSGATVRAGFRRERAGVCAPTGAPRSWEMAFHVVCSGPVGGSLPGKITGIRHRVLTGRKAK